VRLAEAPPARWAVEAPLAPDEPCPSTEERKVTHPHDWSFLDVDSRAIAARADTGPSDELHLQLEFVAPLADGGDAEALESEDEAKVSVHPVRSADVSSYRVIPALSARPHSSTDLDNRQVVGESNYFDPA
jgi:hypothetical protein